MQSKKGESLLDNINLLNNQNYFKPLEYEILIFRYILFNYDGYVGLSFTFQENLAEILIFFVKVISRPINILRSYIKYRFVILFILIFLIFLSICFIFYLIFSVAFFMFYYFNSFLKIQNENYKVLLFLFISATVVVFVYYVLVFYLNYLDFNKTNKFFLFTPEKIYFLSYNKLIKIINKVDLYKEFAKIIAISHLFKNLELLKIFLLIRLILLSLFKAIIVVTV